MSLKAGLRLQYANTRGRHVDSSARCRSRTTNTTTRLGLDESTYENVRRKTLLDTGARYAL